MTYGNNILLNYQRYAEKCLKATRCGKLFPGLHVKILSHLQNSCYFSKDELHGGIAAKKAMISCGFQSVKMGLNF